MAKKKVTKKEVEEYIKFLEKATKVKIIILKNCSSNILGVSTRCEGVDKYIRDGRAK